MTVTIRLGARLRAARKAAGFKTSKDFLKKHNIPASTYSQHESGARTPDDEMLKFYSNVLDVNFNWLKTGEGQPHRRASSTKRNILSEELLDLKQPKVAPEINEKVLAKIFDELLQNSSSVPIEKIVRMAIKIYKEVTSSKS